MRLLDFGEPENYQPLDRGNAFPQFYENGDKYNCHSNALDWHWQFWREQLAPYSTGELVENLMGGEL